MIFFTPLSPSFDQASSLGITTVSSCMMIDEVMYGMIPSANTASWVNAPPEKRLMNWKTPPWAPRANS